MRGTYGSITREAPRFVGRELRWIRTANRDSGLRAVRHEAEAKAARERGDEAAAERHAGRAAAALALTERGRLIEAQLAAQDEAYREHERGVQHDLHRARAADTELRRRYPGVNLPPLRSAEPAPPSAAERAELLYPERVRVPERADAQQTAQAQAHGLPAGAAEALGRWLDGKQAEPEPEHGPEDDAPPRPGTEHPTAEAFGRWLDRTKPAPEQEADAEAEDGAGAREGARDRPRGFVVGSAQVGRGLRPAGPRSAGEAGRPRIGEDPGRRPRGRHRPRSRGRRQRMARHGRARARRDPAARQARNPARARDRGPRAEPERAYAAPAADREAGE